MEGSRKEEFNYDESRAAGGGEDEEDEETRATRRREELRRRQEESTKRGESRDFLNRLLVERNEAEQEETILRAEEAWKLRCLQSQQTRKLGEELLRIKNEDTREQKRRQLLRRDSIELRRLEDRLRSAFAAEDASLQLSEREIRRENEKAREVEEAKAIRGWYRNDATEEQRTLEARRKRDEYRRDLQDQLVLNHRLRQRKAEETRLERKLVEEVVEVLRAEELENQRRKRETASRLRAEERTFLEAREMWKSREKQVLLKEHEDYTRISADKMAAGEQSDAAKIAGSAVREAVAEKIGTKILDGESKKREREEAPYELTACERMIDLQDRPGRAALEKRLAAKRMLEDIERQRIAIEERKVREAEADRAFARCLEEDRRRSAIEEVRRADGRRARGIEYGKALREAIGSNAIRYTEEILGSQAELMLNRKLDEARRIFIDEERSRILAEHEPRLRGFAKPGMSFVSEVVESAKGATSSRWDCEESYEKRGELRRSLVNDPALSADQTPLT